MAKGQSINAWVFIEGDRYKVKSFKIEDTGYNVYTGRRLASKYKATVASGEYLQDNNPIHCRFFCSINGREYQISKATIDSVSLNDDGTHDVVAFNAVRMLHETPFEQTFNDVAYYQAVNAVLQASNVTKAGIVTDVRPGKARPDGKSGRDAIRFTHQFTNATAAYALDVISKATHQNWFIDRKNELWFVGDLYSGRGTRRRKRVPIPDIHKSQSGTRFNPYERVVVTGISPRGGQNPHMLSKNPPRGVATSDRWESSTSAQRKKMETLKTTFSSAHTNQQAQNAAKTVLERLKEDQAGGWVEVPARPDLRPLDTVVFPDNDIFSSREYLVSEVRHDLDTENGFLTKLYLRRWVPPSMITTRGIDYNPPQDSDQVPSGGGSSTNDGGSGGDGVNDGPGIDSPSDAEN